MTALTVLGSMGGIVAFVTAIWIIVRAIFRQVHATEENTGALDRLTDRVDKVAATQINHGERLARLEGRRPGPRN